MLKIQEITGLLPEIGYNVEGNFVCLEDAMNHAEDKQRYLGTTLQIITPSGAIWYNKTRNNDGWKKCGYRGALNVKRSHIITTKK